MNLLQNTTITSEDLEDYAKAVAHVLKNSQLPFCLWLIGDLGAGKTTFSRHLLYALGTHKDTPIVSPTFVFSHIYPTQIGAIAHLDLYRINHPEHLEDFSLDHQDIRGLIVEWPTKAATHPLIQPTHSIKMAHADENTRTFVFRAHKKEKHLQQFP